MGDGEVLALCQDMTITREAFLRGLPGAVGHAAFRIAGADVRHGDGDLHWRIAIDALPDLELGKLRLPRHRVRVFLTGYDDAARRRFVDRFELYFRRAGG